MILRLHGSILPAMAIPLLIVTVWATAIRCISAYVHPREYGSSSIAGMYADDCLLKSVLTRFFSRFWALL